MLSHARCVCTSLADYDLIIVANKSPLLITGPHVELALNVPVNGMPTNFTLVSDSAISYLDHATAVALGDIDGDGDLDAIFALVTSTFWGSSPKRNLVFINDGRGVFSVANGMMLELASDSNAVAVADVNRDGRLDIAFANQGSRNELYYGALVPDFVDASTLSDDVLPMGAVDLLNRMGMGVCDSLSNTDCPDASGISTPRIVRNEDPEGGEGAGGDRPIMGDVTGDGALDVFISRRLFINNGMGRFAAAPANFTNLLTSNPLVLSDLDQDGDLDLICLDLVVYWNDGNGAFAPQLEGGQRPLLTGRQPNECASLSSGQPSAPPATMHQNAKGNYLFGDINADGLMDVVAKTACRDPCCGGHFAIYTNDGTGAMVADAANGASWDPGTAFGKLFRALADVNGDGFDDLIIADNYGSIAAVLNAGASATPRFPAAGGVIPLFTGSHSTPSGSGNVADLPSAKLAFADLNGDGLLDVSPQRLESVV